MTTPPGTLKLMFDKTLTGQATSDEIATLIEWLEGLEQYEDEANAVVDKYEIGADNSCSPPTVLFGVEFLTVPEVANWLRIHTKSVYRMIETKKIRSIKLGTRSYRIPTTAALDLVREAGLNIELQPAAKKP